MKSKQSGVTLIGFLMIMAIVGFFAFMAMKLLPSYSEYMGVAKAMTHITIQRDSGGANQLHVEYDKTIPFMYNISFLLHFEKSVALQGNVG
jgi:hypothetical protein